MNVFMSLSVPTDLGNGEVRVPLFYEIFINHFKKIGWNIYVFISDVHPYDYQMMIPNEVLDLFSRIHFDLCILFNNTFWDISSKVDCPIVIYDVDYPGFLYNKKSLLNNKGRYKYIETQIENRNLLVNEFDVSPSNIIVVPFITGIKANKEEYKRNIVFIGSRFVQSKEILPTKKLSEICTNLEEQKILLQFFQSYYSDPFQKDYVLNSIKNKLSNETFMYLESTNFLNEFSDYKRVTVLSSISDLGLEIYGDPSWRNDDYNQPFLRFCYNDKKVYSLEHNQNLYNTSKISINVNHLQARNSFSWRVFDVMASNSCLVTEYQPALKEICKGIDLPMYENQYDARDICKKLLTNENMRKDIVLQCQELVNTKYRIENVFDDFMNFLGISPYSESDVHKEGSVSFYLLSDYVGVPNHYHSLTKKIVENIFSVKTLRLNKDTKPPKIVRFMGIRILV